MVWGTQGSQTGQLQPAVRCNDCLQFANTLQYRGAIVRTRRLLCRAKEQLARFSSATTSHAVACRQALPGSKCILQARSAHIPAHTQAAEERTSLMSLKACGRLLNLSLPPLTMYSEDPAKSTSSLLNACALKSCCTAVAPHLWLIRTQVLLRAKRRPATTTGLAATADFMLALLWNIMNAAAAAKQTLSPTT